MAEVDWTMLEDQCSTLKGCSSRVMKGRPSRKQIKDQKEIAKGIAAVRRAYEENPGASESAVREQAHKFLGMSLVAIFFQFIFPALAKWAIDWAINRLNLPKGGSSTDRIYG